MNRYVVAGCQAELAKFMDFRCHAHGAFVAERSVAFGVIEHAGHGASNAMILAGVWFEGFNGVNMNIHVAARPGVRWMTRTLLSVVFDYAFIQCGVRRLTGLVEESNYAARSFDEHVGFKLETKLVDAAPGGDLLVYVMRKEDCRYLSPKYRDHASAQLRVH